MQRAILDKAQRSGQHLRDIDEQLVGELPAVRQGGRWTCTKRQYGYALYVSVPSRPRPLMAFGGFLKNKTGEKIVQQLAKQVCCGAVLRLGGVVLGLLNTSSRKHRANTHTAALIRSHRCLCGGMG